MGKTTEKTETQICCAACGSLNVQYAVWYSPNTGAAHDLFGSWNAGDNTFCEDCDMEGRDPNPCLVDSDAEPEAFNRARRKLARKKGA
jgi:hypothetical protein